MKAAQSESGATACVVTEAQAGSSGSFSQQQTQQQKEGSEPLIVLNSETSCDGVPPSSTAGWFEKIIPARL